MPHLDDLAIDHAIDEYSGEANTLTRWSDPPELALMCARNRQIGRHKVTLGDEFMDCNLPVWKGGALVFHTLPCVF